MRIFKVNPSKFHLSINGEVSDAALNLSTPCTPKGTPVGLVARSGLVYNTLPENLPVAVFQNGGFTIKKTCDVNVIARADAVIAGAALLVDNYAPVKPSDTLSLKASSAINRVGLGITRDGDVVVVYKKGTVKDIQYALWLLQCCTAMLLTTEYAVFGINKDGIDFNAVVPTVMLSFADYSEYPRPFIVLDPGHGGSDSGGNGKKYNIIEKDLNLDSAYAVGRNLKDYTGTTFFTRYEDISLGLHDRAYMANAINADLFLSIHSNANDGKASGFETFIGEAASDKTKELRAIFHGVMSDMFKAKGFKDRGMKARNFTVISATTCPSMLTENLFMDNAVDAAFLNGQATKQLIDDTMTQGIVKALGLRFITTLPHPEVKKLYRVQLGAYAIKENAEALLEELKNRGYKDAFIKYG